MVCLVTPRVLKWLHNGRSARILHLFEGVCNLVDDQSEVMSLVTPQIGPGPFTMVSNEISTNGLDVHLPVSIDQARQTLLIGPLAIDFGETAVWQPEPDWRRLQNADWLPAPPLPAGIQSHLQQVVEGIIANDAAACQAGVYALAGRGSGLTPTGDDVLMGVLYGLWVWLPRREWMELIVDTAVPRTTTLSANFLRAAAAGEATWQWHDLVNGRANAIANILAIGHTSGADAWAGFVYTGSRFRRKQHEFHE